MLPLCNPQPAHRYCTLSKRDVRPSILPLHQAQQICPNLVYNARLSFWTHFCYLLTCLGYLLHNRLDFLLWYNIWYNMQEFNVQSENWLIASLWFFCLVYTFVVLFASRSRQMVRKRRTISHLRRATSRRRRQRETGPTEDILQLAKNSQMYSPLLNNYTLPGNSSAAGRGNGSSSMHHHDEGAVVYGKTELVVGNLRHFQEYSIEVALYSNDFDDNNYVNNDADKFSQWNTDTLCSVM